MTSSHPFNTLIEIATIDEHISHLESRIIELQKEVTMLQNKIKSSAQGIVQHQNTVHNYKKTKDELELVLLEIKNKSIILEKKLHATASTKEASSIEKERVTLDEKKEAIETKILDTWDTLEKEEAQSPTLMQAHHILKANTEQYISNITQEINRAQEEIRSSQATCQQKRSMVPHEWVEHYDQLRNRIPCPIVQIKGSECTMCYQDIPAKDILRLQRGAIIPCHGCQRMLYHAAALGLDHKISELLP